MHAHIYRNKNSNTKINLILNLFLKGKINKIAHYLHIVNKDTIVHIFSQKIKERIISRYQNG